MSKYKSRSVWESLSNAIRGLNLAFFSQKNFVIELFISFIVVLIAILLKFSITDLCIVIIMSVIVLVFELLNSVVEFTLDAVYKNNYSKLVEMAKDISAGMVLLISLISIIVGILLFGKYILN